MLRARNIEIFVSDQAKELTWKVLTSRALVFLADAVRAFQPRVERLRAQRAERRRRFEAGELPGFRRETAALRARAWRCPQTARGLRRRQVGITGPVDRRSVLNALGSGADVFRADLEDITSPSWSNVLEGHSNLCDACRRTISYQERGRAHSLGETSAMLFVTPRGLHLSECHVEVDGRAVPATVFDLVLFSFHCARVLAARGEGPFFCLPKIQCYEEARFYNDLFVHLERALRIPVGTFKAAVLIETLPAAFQMNEILWELRPHSAGLNYATDLVFDYIKTRALDPEATLPDWDLVTTERSFLGAVSTLLVQTCHRRGVHAIGGMAPEIPIKEDRAKNAAALEAVRREKMREAAAGYDGTWVAHPSVVPIARQAFDGVVRGDDQLHVTRAEEPIARADLLDVPSGARTEDGARRNVRVALLYLDEWLHGRGAVTIEHKLAGASTAEIARAQLWKWVHHRVPLEDGEPLTRERFAGLFDDEAARVGASLIARVLLKDLCLAKRIPEYMTVPAYALLSSEIVCQGKGLSDPSDAWH